MCGESAGISAQMVVDNSIVLTIVGLLSSYVRNVLEFAQFGMLVQCSQMCVIASHSANAFLKRHTEFQMYST